MVFELGQTSFTLISYLTLVYVAIIALYILYVTVDRRDEILGRHPE